MATGGPSFGEQLWVERISDRVVAGVSLPIPAPYLYVGAVVVFDVFVLHTIQQLTVGRNTVLDNPSWLALPATVLLATFTNRYARDRYADALATIRIENRTGGEPDAFERLVPARFKQALFVALVGAYYGYLVVTGRIPTIVAYEGVAGLFGWLVVIPFGYGPVLVETAAMYVSLHFLFPRRFRANDVEIYFFDPHNLGGLRPIGELLKHSYYLFTAALILVTVLLYAPFVFPEMLYTPYQPPERFVSAVVSTLWLIGLCSIGYSLWELHRHMRDKRRETLRTLERRLYELVDDPYDVHRSLLEDEAHRRFEREQRRIEQVRDTSEYPATITTWTQIFISVVLPIVVQAVIRSASAWL